METAGSSALYGTNLPVGSFLTVRISSGPLRRNRAKSSVIDERLAERYLIDEILENDLDHPERQKLMKRDMELAGSTSRTGPSSEGQCESRSNT